LKRGHELFESSLPAEQHVKQVAELEQLLGRKEVPNLHWQHRRMVNVVDILFASVQLGMAAAKRFNPVDFAIAMIRRLVRVRFRRLDQPELPNGMLNGVEFGEWP